MSELVNRKISGKICIFKLFAVPLACLAFSISASGADQGGAGAAAASDNKNTLDEIVITARYTSETQQRTPISVAVLSGARLEQDGITNLTDVAQTTSSTSFIPGGSVFGKSMGALIRGVGNTDFIFAEQPGVGIYIDDVYFSTLFGSSFELGDVDRVEVLKGPQGTLFGRNNEGGAVRIFNKKPIGDDSGFLEIGYGTYNQRRVRGSLDVRVTDQLFVRVTGAARSQDGYVDQVDFACVHPTLAGNIKPITNAANCVTGKAGSEDVDYARAAVRWTPTEQLEINLTADTTQDNGTVGADRTVYIAPAGTSLQVANAKINVPYYGIPEDSRFLTPGFYETYATNATYTNPLTGVAENPVNNVSGDGFSGTVDWDATPGIHVKSITAYRKYDGEFAFKQGGSPIWVAGDFTQVHHNQTSEEIRFSGALFNNTLDWVVGGYYFSGHELLGGPVDISTLSPLVGFPFVFTQNDTFSSQSESGFSHLLYHLTDKLGVEAGARYTADLSHVKFDHDLILIGVPFFPITYGKTSDSHTDPKVALQYQWTEDAMTYVSYSKGYRSGGFNPRPNDAAQVTTFEPEVLTAYEAGLKSEWFEHRLRINPAFYVSNYTNLQQQLFTVDKSGVPADIYGNVGKVRIEGVELDVDAKPTDSLLLEASVGDLHYKTLFLGTAADVPGGPGLNTMPIGVPKFKGNIAAQYSFSVGGGTLAVRVDDTYQSHVWFDAPNSAISSQAGYAIMNGRLSFNSGNGLWETAFLATNMLGKQYYTSLNNNISSWGTVEGQVGKPREVLVTVKRSFGGEGR